MDVWVVCFNPKDFPSKYVVRKHTIGKFNNESTNEYYIGDTLDDVRAKIPMGMLRFPRVALDHPAIVESWL